MSILEAMASGLPVVSTAIAGIPEAVSDEETGLLVSPGDVDGLTRALERLLESHSLRQQMGAAARRRAEKYFDAEVIGSQVKTLWSEVLDEHRSHA